MPLFGEENADEFGAAKRQFACECFQTTTQRSSPQIANRCERASWDLVPNALRVELDEWLTDVKSRETMTTPCYWFVSQVRVLNGSPPQQSKTCKIPSSRGSLVNWQICALQNFKILRCVILKPAKHLALKKGDNGSFLRFENQKT